MKNIVLPFLLNLFLLQLAAQIGGHRNSINWHLYQSDNTTIIFSKNQTHPALRIKHIIEKIQTIENPTMGVNKYHINLLLHPENSNFNGFVSIFPWRTEFYSISPPNNYYLGTSDWLESLTIHEYRHVLQNSTARKGITKLAACLFGNIGWNITHSLVPLWFWEGDATWFETAVSKNGRGRSPFFFNLFREMATTKLKFKYNQIRNGSFNQLTPSPYTHGYILTEYLRAQNDNNIWQIILEESGAMKGFIFPFQNSIKRNAGLKLKELNKNALDNFYKKNIAFLNKQPRSKFTPISKNKTRTYAQYRMPIYDPLNDSTIYCIKRGFDYDRRIIKIQKNKKESKITRIGFNVNNEFSKVKNTFSWTERVPHIRRKNTTYYQIVIYNQLKNKKTYIHHHTNYFSPTINPTKSELVAIEATNNLESNIVFMDFQGRIIKKVKYSNTAQILFPTYGTENTIFVVIKENGLLSIKSFNTISDSWADISKKTRNNIGKLFYKEGSLYFSASFSGKDDIYKMNIRNKKIVKIAAQNNGLYQPTIDNNNNLLASIFKANGYEIIRITKENFLNIPLDSFQVENPSIFYSTSFKTVKKLTQLDTIEPIKSKKYNRFIHSFNLHTWVPSTDLNNIKLNLYSQNILNNTSILAIYNYDVAHDENYYSVNFNYSALFPILNLKIKYVPKVNLSYYKIISDTLKAIHTTYRATIISPKINIPLNLSKNSIWNQNLNISLGSNIYINKSDGSTSINHYTINSGLTFSITSPLKKKSLFPSWGLIFRSNYEVDIRNLNKHCDMSVHFLIPGLLRFHNILLTGSFYKRAFDAKKPLRFNNQFQNNKLLNITQLKNESRISITYFATLWHPDWGLGDFIFFKRLRMAPFCEYSNFDIEGTPFDYRGYGVDFIFDISIANSIPISIGVRSGNYKLNIDNKWKKEIQFILDLPFTISNEYRRTVVGVNKIKAYF